MIGRQLEAVWVWVEGRDPDPAYLRQVVNAAVPEAQAAGAALPIQGERVDGPWPGDFWPRALARLNERPAWTDRRQYDLAGWAGQDSRDGAHLFVVSIYRLPAPAAGPVGTPVPAPAFVVPNVPVLPPPGGPGVPPGPPSPLPADAYPHRTGISAGELAESNPYYAGFGPRLVAGLVDLVIIALVEIAVGLIFVVLGRKLVAPGDDTSAWPVLLTCGGLLLGLVVMFAYLADFWAWRGQTPGMMLMGLRVVQADGSRPGLSRAFLRAVGWAMSLLTLGIGFLLVLSDERRQGLADRVAGTYVVPLHPPPGPRPADLPGYAPAEGGRADELPIADRGLRNDDVPAPTPTNRTQNSELRTQNSPALRPTVEAAWMPAPEPTVRPPAPDPRSLVQTEAAWMPTPESAVRPPTPDPRPPDPAEAAWQRGIGLLAEGSREPGGDRPWMIIEPEAAQAATRAFGEAVQLAPSGAGYRYWLGVARRYGEGYAEAAPDFEAAARLDPGFWDAQMQRYFGPRWHDAFAYPAWNGRSTVLPDPLRALLPGQPGSRLVLVREGATRLVAVLTHTRRAGWKLPPGSDAPARLEVVPGATPSGLIVALYVALRDDPQHPYRGETFINPAEVLGPDADATALGQNLMLALARQSYTYLIFADETGGLLLNRRLVFEPATGQQLAATATQVQAAAYQAVERNQPMSLTAFQQAAHWHMSHFPLERVQI